MVRIKVLIVAVWDDSYDLGLNSFNAESTIPEGSET